MLSKKVMQKGGRSWLPVDVRVLSNMRQVLKRDVRKEGFGDEGMNTLFHALSIALNGVLLL